MAHLQSFQASGHHLSVLSPPRIHTTFSYLVPTARHFRFSLRTVGVLVTSLHLTPFTVFRSLGHAYAALSSAVGKGPASSYTRLRPTGTGTAPLPRSSREPRARVGHLRSLSSLARNACRYVKRPAVDSPLIYRPPYPPHLVTHAANPTHPVPRYALSLPPRLRLPTPFIDSSLRSSSLHSPLRFVSLHSPHGVNE